MIEDVQLCIAGQMAIEYEKKENPEKKHLGNLRVVSKSFHNVLTKTYLKVFLLSVGCIKKNLLKEMSPIFHKKLTYCDNCGDDGFDTHMLLCSFCQKEKICMKCGYEIGTIYCLTYFCKNCNDNCKQICKDCGETSECKHTYDYPYEKVSDEFCLIKAKDGRTISLRDLCKRNHILEQTKNKTRSAIIKYVDVLF